METLNQGFKTRPLPLWVRVLQVLVIPVLLALVAVLPDWGGCNPPVVEPTENIRIVGIAYFENGLQPIPNCNIRLMDLTMGQEFTSTDGGFTFERVPLSSEYSYLKIGIKLKGHENYTSIVLPVDITLGAREIDLGSVVFPVKPVETEIRSRENNSSHLGEEQNEENKTGLPASPALSDVRILYPSGVFNPTVKIYPDTWHTDQRISCLAKVEEGKYLVKLQTDEGAWLASFTHRDEFVVGSKFKFVDN
ncbi:MAG: hypothetical protein AAFZ15_15370 [Bacteroidota bacterium]